MALISSAFLQIHLCLYVTSPVLCGCETWSLALRKEHCAQEDFAPEERDVIGGW
jgi:hypothetical protein